MTGSLLRAEHLAAMLGVSKDWIYSETRAGRIPHVKLGRYYRYREDSIGIWLSAIERGKMAPTTRVGGHRANGPAPAQED